MKRLLSSIPNTITLLNLLMGCVAVVFALKGWTLFAGYCIFMAAVFDFCDGLLARLLKAYSELGKQLDSLSDMVSFGVAPAALLYYEMGRVLSPEIAGDLSTMGWELFSFFPFILALFSALRLAKFNIDTRQGDQFLGLPTPACALLITSFLMYARLHPALDSLITPLSISLSAVVLSTLLVVELPMLALKFKGFAWTPNRPRYFFIILCGLILLVTLVAGQGLALAVTLIILAYILYSVLLTLCTAKS